MKREAETAPRSGLPEQIERTLIRVIRRARLVALIRGIGAVAAAAVFSVLLIMAIDNGFVIFSRTTRWALYAGAWVVTLATALWFLLRPLARALSLSGIARLIESQHPELQERISSAVELLSSTDSRELLGSQTLIAALVEEADADVRTIQPRREVTFRAARPCLLAAGGVLAVLALLLALWPQMTLRLLHRAVDPGANLPNVHADEITVTPGDQVITEGSPLNVNVEVASRGVRSVFIRFLEPDGNDRPEAMHPVFNWHRQDDAGERRQPRNAETRMFALQCPPANKTYSYRIHAGDALTRYYAVTVVPPPKVTGLGIRCDYPEYTRREAFTNADADGEISAVVGTEVTVTARTNSPLATAHLLVDGPVPLTREAELAPSADGSGTTCTFRFRMEQGLLGRWSVELVDRHGFRNSPSVHRIDALPDTRPLVRITHPSKPAEDDKPLRLRPSDQLPLLYVAEDDFGLAGMQLLLKAGARDLKPLNVVPPAGAQTPLRTVQGDTVLDLSKVDLAGANSLRFRLKATDTLPADSKGPQVGLSAWRTIEIDRTAETYAAQMLRELQKSIRESLEFALAELEAAKNDSVFIQEEAPERELSATVQERIDTALAHLKTADTTVRELAERVENGTYDLLAPRLRALSDEHVRKAEDYTGQVKLADEPAQRSELADEADFQIDQSILVVKRMLEELERLFDAAQKEQQLGELAQREENLADERTAMDQAMQQPQTGSPQPRLTEQDWEQQQNDLADSVARMLQEAMRQDSSEKRARELAEEARDLQKDQMQLSKDTQLLGDVQRLEATLDDLARQQEELLADAAAESLARPSLEPMKEAIENIRKRGMDRALLKQNEAAALLGAEANRLKQEMRAKDILDGIEEIAKNQDKLTEKAAEAARRFRNAQEKKNDQAAAQARKEAKALSEEQDKAAEKMGEAAKMAEGMPWSVSGLFRGNTTRNQMRKAAQEMAAGKPKDSAEAAAKSSEMLKNMIDRLRPQVQQQALVDDKTERADDLTELNRRQRDLAALTSRYEYYRSRALNQMKSAQLAHLQKEQEEIARETTELAQEVREREPQKDNVERDAAREANKAARRLKEENLSEATKNAEEAGRKLKQLAGQTHGDIREEARRLAQRQQRVARETRRLQEGNQKELAQSRQQSLDERTDDLANDTKDLQEKAAESPKKTREKAAKAIEEIGKASRQQEAAEKAIGERRSSDAKDNQYYASRHLGAAAAALDGFADALAKATRKNQSAAQAKQNAELEKAADSTAQAAETKTGEDTEQAARDLQAARNRAAQRAQQMGLQPFSPRRHAASIAGAPRDPRGRRSGVQDSTIARLRRMQISLEDWAKLPGELRSDILQAAEQGDSPEYRALVKRYLREIARRGAEDKE